MKRRVVVTGLGLVTSVGENTSLSWNGILTNENGTVPISHLPPFSHMNSVTAPTYAATIPNATSIMKEYRSHPFTTSNTLFYALTLSAAKQVFEDSKFPVEKLSMEERYRTGVIIGTAASDKGSMERSLVELKGRDYGFLNKMALLQILPNLGSSLISIKYGLNGYSNTPVVACSSGLIAIGEGVRAIQDDLADTMVVGGAEKSVYPFTLQGFTALKALSTKFSKTPESASRPFDQQRDGFVLGDGAGILLLEVFLF